MQTVTGIAIKAMLPPVFNSLLDISTEALIELVKPEDGTPIAEFPTTPGE